VDKLIAETKEYFINNIQQTEDKYGLLEHVPEVVKWVKKIREYYPKSDLEVVLFGAWLHDVSHYLVNDGEDHAVKSEEMSREFLSGKIDKDTIDRVCHCVRSHRCKDVAPETLEAKVLACADSASHMSGIIYMDMLSNGHRVATVDEKLERDYRDIFIFPEVKELLTPIYKLWKSMLLEYQKLNLPKGE
jgi:HD superfamily phosphodiesterase